MKNILPLLFGAWISNCIAIETINIVNRLPERLAVYLSVAPGMAALKIDSQKSGDLRSKYFDTRYRDAGVSPDLIFKLSPTSDLKRRSYDVAEARISMGDFVKKYGHRVAVELVAGEVVDELALYATADLQSRVWKKTGLKVQKGTIRLVAN